MPSESWVLDGVILTSGTFTLMELTADPPRARRDWIAAADSEAAALFRQPKHENRTITMKVRVTPQASMDTALDKIGLLVDKLRAASATPVGIALVWTPNGSTRARTFTVLAGEITGLPIAMSGEGFSWLLNSPILTIELTCHPYWRGTEVLTSTASSSTPFVTLEIAGVTGDVDAEGRLIVTDTATQSRRHVEWGLEGPLTYNSGTSLLIESDNLVTSGFAGVQTTQTGAYDVGGGNTVVGTTAVPPSTVALCGTGNLSHVGSFRVKARVWSGGGSTTQVRFSWRAGDGPLTSNGWAAPLVASRWEELELGTITIPATVVGTQRWTGQIEAYDPGTAGVYIDYLTLVPTSDGYGKARAVYSYVPGVIVGYDYFTATTAAAALNARVAPVGGTWATSGDATDFAFADAPVSTDETVSRSAVSGTAGRFALLGTSTPTDVEARVDFYYDSVPSGAGTWIEGGIVARYVNSTNYLYATFRRTADTVPKWKSLEIRQVVAGVETTIASADFPAATSSISNWWTVSLIAYASGAVFGRIMSAAGQIVASATGSSTAVATAGALASGKTGIFDRHTSASAATRYYDAFTVSTPAAEPIVLYSGRNMQVRYDDTLRQDSTGTYTGRPPSYRGGRFLVPVGTSRVLVKARRNDIEAAADDNVIDATQIQVGWTPRGLAVPR